MHFEPWMFAAMEDNGYMDTKDGHINRVARYLVEHNAPSVIDELTFVIACTACEVDPASFTNEDLKKLERKMNSLV